MKKSSYAISVLLITILGFIFRIAFAPEMNFESDSFTVLLSAKNIFENGSYTLPPIALTDFISYQKFTGWGVGYPLSLAFIFNIFGYSEFYARLFTIIFSALVIPLTAILGERFYSRKLGLVAAILVAVNPLLICFSGRILTANMGFALFFVSIVFVLLATIKRKESVQFITFRELLESRKRLFLFYLACFFYGFTLCARDDFLMFFPVFIYIIFNIIYLSRLDGERSCLRNSCKLIIPGFLLAVIAYLPSLYFNYKNYGKLFTSSHQEYGAVLDFNYFMKGSASSFGIPGWGVILLTILIFAFPAVSVLLVRFKTKASAILCWITILIIVPLILVCGAFPVAASGAAPRYILPIIPFIIILSAMILVINGIVPNYQKKIFCVFLVLWQVLAFYPPELMFKAYSKTAYLTQYSPWYNTKNYMNYPHPVTKIVNWVIDNTPNDAIILSDFDRYHYYFYSGRDVMSRDDFKEISKYVENRPIFFIEHHRLSVNPRLVHDWKEKLLDNSLDIKIKDAIPFFSPSNGKGELKIYQVERVL